MIAEQTPLQALQFLRQIVPPYYRPAIDEAIRALQLEERAGVVHPVLRL